MAEPLTLAVPYYSGFTLFEHTLQSFTFQDADCRVLVVDDSPQGLSKLERARMEDAVGDLPLRVLRNEQNLGMARTWNRCLDEADTDLVTIAHADDLLAPGYAAVVRKLAEERVPAVFSGARVIDGEGERAWTVTDWVKRMLVPSYRDVLRLSGDGALVSLMRGNFIYCPSLCYRRSLLKLRFDPSWRFVLDMDLTVRLLLAGETLLGAPHQPFYLYRRHEEGATARMTAELTRFQEEAAFYGRVADDAKARGFTRAARTAQAQRIVQLNLGFCIARDLLTGELAASARKATLFRNLYARRRVS